MRKVLIVGTGKGLGKCLLEQYLAEGAKVFGTVSPGNDKAHAELHGIYGDTLTTIGMDIGNEESVIEGIGKVKSLTDSLDVLINVAGILPKDSHLPLEEVDLDGFMRAININTMGAIRVIKYALPLIRKGTDKVILNVSSAGGSMTHITKLDPTEDDFPYGYCMSKSALNMASAILKRYVKPDGINVILVHPGVMRTPMNDFMDEETKKTLIDPAVSAAGIMKLIEDHKSDINGPIFFDYTGSEFPF